MDYINFGDPRIRKLLSNDSVLQRMNQQFITLQDPQIKKNNLHLLLVVNAIIDRMKSADTLFKKTYRRIGFAGSFYKRTKITEPTEFDLDLIISLPISSKSITFIPGPAGFTRIHLQDTKFECTSFTQQEQKQLNKLLTNGFLNQDYFRRWMEGIVRKATLPMIDRVFTLELPNNVEYRIRVKKSGPAFTLSVDVDSETTISIDLVPALAFDQEFPHEHIQYRLSQTRRKTWLAVPKPLHEQHYGSDKDLYWRLSFYEQEKEIFSRYGQTKPLIRLMKKLRDTENWKSLASYYLETLFLHEVENMHNNFQTEPLTLLFVKMLEKLRIACSRHFLPYYWDDECNLFDKIGTAQMRIMEGRLRNMTMNITRKIEADKFIIATYILNPVEYIILRGTFFIIPDLEEEQPEEQSSCTIS